MIATTDINRKLSLLLRRMSIYLYTFASLHSQPSPTTAPSWPSPKWTDWTWAPISASPPMAFRQQSASVWCSLCTVSIWGGAGPSILAYLNIYSSAPGSGTASCSWDQVGRMQGAVCSRRDHSGKHQTQSQTTTANATHTKSHSKSCHAKYALHFNFPSEGRLENAVYF